MLGSMHDRGYGRIVNIGSEAGVAIVPGLAAYRASKHALGALTQVIQDAHHDCGIKAWVVCPGFVDTEMGQVVPGADRGAYLHVDDVVDVVRHLLSVGDNVKLGPEILVRTRPAIRVTIRELSRYARSVIFPNHPQRRSLVARLGAWRSTRRSERDSVTDHHRMVEALRPAPTSPPQTRRGRDAR
jgi:short-subunit dehydrogenase